MYAHFLKYFLGGNLFIGNEG